VFKPVFARYDRLMTASSLSTAAQTLSILADAKQTEVVDVTESGHLQIVVGERATLMLVIRISGEMSDIEHTTDIVIGAESFCTVLCINAAKSSSAVIIHQRGDVGPGATVQWQNVTLGGATVTHDLISRVSGAHGTSGIDWMFYAKNTENQKLTVRNIFDGRNGAGEILMRGVAEEKGHAVAKGMIEIGLQGGGTNTYLTQEVLMLDSSAKVDAVPGLEIKTNDVKASHSATVTRLTPEDLFYFASRGIPKSDAREMYIRGFLGAITERITDDTLKDEVLGLIEKKYSL
jgi:Fe-S cluster assembly scaffold protein SufB